MDLTRTRQPTSFLNRFVRNLRRGLLGTQDTQKWHFGEIFATIQDIENFRGLLHDRRTRKQLQKFFVLNIFKHVIEHRDVQENTKGGKPHDRNYRLKAWADRKDYVVENGNRNIWRKTRSLSLLNC